MLNILLNLNKYLIILGTKRVTVSFSYYRYSFLTEVTLSIKAKCPITRVFRIHNL